MVLTGLLAISIFIIVFPYSVLDFKSFYDNLRFQEGVAIGRIPVFFTVQFQQTSAYLFQVMKIFPWIIGLPVLVLGILGIIPILYSFLKERREKRFILFFLPALYFLYNGSLFVKWTRYMIPLAPFFCLFAAVLLLTLFEKFKKNHLLVNFTLALCLTVVSFLFFYAFAFWQIYRKQDTRITASEWIYQNIPSSRNLLLEPLDVATLPLPMEKFTVNYHRIWFDFYGLDDYNSETQREEKIDELSTKLSDVDYIVIGSRRLYATRLRLKYSHPLTARYYRLLFNGKLGFDKIKQVSSYPNFWGIELNDDDAEETFQVFDHPKVMIFKKARGLSTENLKKILFYD